MHFSTTAISLTAIVAAGLAFAQDGFVVNTPNSLLTCQPSQLSWTGGTPPYYPRVTEGGGTTGTLKSFDMQTGTTLTWTVDIAAGTSVTITVSDSAGLIRGSAAATINQGSSTSCIGSSSSSGGSSSTSGGSSSSASRSSSSSASRSSSSSSPSSSASSAAGSSSTARPSTSAATSSSAAAAAATTSSGSGNGAESVRGFSAVVAGVVGVAAAALL